MPDEQSTPASLTIVTMSPAGSMRGGREQARQLWEEGVPLDKLQSNFANFMNGVEQIVAIQQTKAGDFQLDEISFSAEISIDGEFKLLGSGVGVEASGGVTFKLRRQTNKSS